ncbi:unnamed protein product [Pleuronectes platessa]|uniref:Uncharacterized protein n=1 Tax=Pleuronectes platessa TaxID=8262 RepID=A0A9N7Y1C3_PLEPL|nr:unnamed protein product [Pleuronectes platessa]
MGLSSRRAQANSNKHERSQLPPHPCTSFQPLPMETMGMPSKQSAVIWQEGGSLASHLWDLLGLAPQPRWVNLASPPPKHKSNSIRGYTPAQCVRGWNRMEQVCAPQGPRQTSPVSNVPQLLTNSAMLLFRTKQVAHSGVLKPFHWKQPPAAAGHVTSTVKLEPEK